MSTYDLNALEALEKAARPAPWGHNSHPDNPETRIFEPGRYHLAKLCAFESGADFANAELICAIRNAAPAMTRDLRDCITTMQAIVDDNDNHKEWMRQMCRACLQRVGV